MKKFDLVDKECFEADPFHAPFETIQAENRSSAKHLYIKAYKESKYINVLCRISRKGSYDF